MLTVKKVSQKNLLEFIMSLIEALIIIFFQAEFIASI